MGLVDKLQSIASGANTRDPYANSKDLLNQNMASVLNIDITMPAETIDTTAWDTEYSEYNVAMASLQNKVFDFTDFMDTEVASKVDLLVSGRINIALAASSIMDKALIIDGGVSQIARGCFPEDVADVVETLSAETINAMDSAFTTAFDFIDFVSGEMGLAELQEATNKIMMTLNAINNKLTDMAIMSANGDQTMNDMLKFIQAYALDQLTQRNECVAALAGQLLGDY